MGLTVVHPGLHTTIQDLGRAGYREWGVPVAGAFDTHSHRLANALLGNAASDATLEMTLMGGVYEADAELALALAGAVTEARIERNGAEVRRLEATQSFTLRRGERLSIRGMTRGARSYLAVAGGWQTETLLGSRSTEVPLRVGDSLACRAGSTPARRPAESIYSEIDMPVIEIVDGPDIVALEDADWWKDARFRAGNVASRMGLRLEGPRVEVAAEPERLSAPVLPGAIQIAGGRPILLGVACGTLGGYPHVGQVVSADLWRVGQLRPGTEVRLRRVTLEAAQMRDQAERTQRERRNRIIGVLASDGSAFSSTE